MDWGRMVICAVVKVPVLSEHSTCHVIRHTAPRQRVGVTGNPWVD